MFKQQTTGFKLPFNHSNALPRRLIAIDCESYRQECYSGRLKATQTFRLAVSKYCRFANNKPVGVETKHWDNAKDLRNYVYSKTGDRYTTWIIAHGLLADFRLAEFARDFSDKIIVPDAPRAKRSKCENDIDDPHTEGLCIIESPPTIIGCRVVSTQGRCIFVDTLNWFPIPLRDIGKSIGIEKMDMPRWNDDNEKWRTYCERDTDILFAAFTELMNFVRTKELGMFRYTAASQAIAAYRHRFTPQQIYIHDNAVVKSWEREAYFGGRSEVFKQGTINDTCHYVDVNALFPSIMQSAMVPYKLVEYDNNITSSEAISESTAGECVALCEIQTDRAMYPVRREASICYPTGRFRTALCGQELATAKRCGHLRTIFSIARYDCHAGFKLFVNELWTLRQAYRKQGERLYADFVKFIMNSLYGKFAQWSPRWINCEDRPDVDEWRQCTIVDWTTGEIHEYRKFGPLCQKKQPKLEKRDSFVAISAFITSAARVRMNQLRAIAGEKNVYYQGVDGLIVNDDGLVRLESADEVNPSELGKLRLDYSGSPTQIHGVADYRLGGKVVMAGRPSNAVQQDDETWLATMLSSKNDMFTGKPPVGMEEYSIEWRRSQHYNKGTFDDDGWLKPFHFDNQTCSGNVISCSVDLTSDAILSTTAAYESNDPPSHASEALSTTRIDSSNESPLSACNLSLWD